MSLSLIMKVLHVLAAFWYMTGIVGRGITFWQAGKTTNVHTVHTLLQVSELFERWMVFPGSVVVLLFALVTAWLQGWPIFGIFEGAATNWVLASLILYNDQVLPFAGLDGLKVKAPFRGHDLGRRLAEWRVEQARQAYGEECVLITGLLRSNHASRAVATKWSREFIEPVRVVIMPVRLKPPHPIENITVREIEPRDYSEFATQQNRFYRDYNLYKPTDPTVIANCLQIIAAERQMYRLFVAVDRAGNLLAGARVWLRGLLKVDVINQVPSALRILNPILHVLPADYTIRDIAVEGFWHAPGQERAARYLWEAMRWHCAAFGSTLVISVDPRSPLLNIFQLKPWHQPRIEVAYAVHGPVSSERHRLVYGFNRV